MWGAFVRVVAVLILASGLFPGLPCPESFAQAAKGGGYQPEPSAGSHPGGPDADRSKYKDSYKYYGPNGLWYKWSEGQKLGRDTWLLLHRGQLQVLPPTGQV